MMMAGNESGGRPGWIRIVILLIVVAAVAGVLGLKGSEESPVLATSSDEPTSLPSMIDLGADKCIPCKTMAPILEKLKTDLAGQCDIQFIDVWKNPDQGPKYGVKIIPTQIFFDPGGKELFRHEGFFSREDILGTFAEHGFTFATD